MPKRSHLFLAISVAVVLAAIACGGEKAADGAAEPTAAPTEEVQAAPVVAEATQVTVPSPTSEPVSTATVPPTTVSGLNGATPTGGLAAVTAGDEVRLVERAPGSITVRGISDMRHYKGAPADEAERAANIRALPESWRGYVRKRLREARARGETPARDGAHAAAQEARQHGP